MADRQLLSVVSLEFLELKKLVVAAFVIFSFLNDNGIAFCQISDAPIDIAAAKQYLDEADEIFKTDDAKLWGKSLSGPVMFVDRQSRIVVANQVDKDHKLRSVDGVFTGRLEPNVMVANTAVQWNGTKWTMLLWPLPDELNDRKVLLAHEAWHRIQNEIGFKASGAANDHLNELNGRYWIQLEWRALRSAIQSTQTNRKEAISDALHFREYRPPAIQELG